MATIAPHATSFDRDTFHLVEKDAHDGGHASPVLFGFWIYLMSDALIFASLFATYGVLSTSYAGGPTPRDLFHLDLVALNTAILLVSSITYGFGMLAMEKGRKGAVQMWLVITAVLGIAFTGITTYEFFSFTAEGATPQRSGYWSGFYTLVGTHGLHVAFGVLWIFIMMVQVGKHGLNLVNKRRLMCLSMFWHFLDVIWIGVFTFVYLMGAMR